MPTQRRSPVSSILAEGVDVVIGVDTHTDTHTAALLTPVGAVLAERTAPSTREGLGGPLAWARGHTVGLSRAWVLDGARSHGVGLLRQLRAAGETVLEGPRVKGPAGRRGGKSDSLDAAHIA